MSDYGVYPRGSIPQELLDRAVFEFSHYTVSMVLNQRLFGSGTLVAAEGQFGVLTAHHVADAIWEEGVFDLGLNISTHRHRFTISSVCLERLTLGTPASNRQPETGPDLAFLRILDPGALTTIQSIKSFYPLSRRTFAPYDDLPMENLPWFVVGAPAALTRDIGELGSAGHTLAAVHFSAEASFRRLDRRDDFDFVTLEVLAGEQDFPASYQGVSGGGLWVLPLTMDPDVGPSSIGYEAPVLTGVAFYQAEERDRRREIIGHGPHSIYSTLLLELKARGGGSCL